MDLHKFIGETRKITEGDLYDQSAEGEMEMSQRPEVNDELIASLSSEMPDMAEMDPEELKKGLSCEMDHFDTVGGDVSVVAGLAMDNIKKYPGKGYYTALEQLQTELGQAQEQGSGITTETQPMASDEEAEPSVSTEPPVEEPTAMESKVKETMVAAGGLDMHGSAKGELGSMEKKEKDEEDDLKKEQHALDASTEK